MARIVLTSCRFRSVIPETLKVLDDDVIERVDHRIADQRGQLPL